MKIMKYYENNITKIPMAEQMFLLASKTTQLMYN